MAVAEDARLHSGATDVWAVLDARMDEIHAARFAHDGQGWQALVAPALCSPQDLVALWQAQPPSTVAGNALAAFGGRLPTGNALRLASARPAARALLACARSAWPGQVFADAAAAQPLYLRQQVALTTAERAARGRAVP
jgi:tRNA threonylcarbamoyladenosine biosynthesis protein TsaB